MQLADACLEVVIVSLERLEGVSVSLYLCNFVAL